MNVLVIFTCFNRKQKTINCIKKIVNGNKNINFQFVIVDAGSCDGTLEEIKNISTQIPIKLLEEENVYYSQGMHIGMEYAIHDLNRNFNYLFMCNDDVDFFEGAIQNLIEQSIEQNDSIIVGATSDSQGNLSYGAIKYIKGYKYITFGLADYEKNADSCNANAVLIPYDMFLKVGSIDSKYIHSLGDFDYGLQLSRAGFAIHTSKQFVGICNDNPSKGTWTDISLSRKDRIKAKENVKGAPAKQWYYFLKKNFGLLNAIKGSITPFIRILLRR